MERKIDYNRGVRMRVHNSSGITVYMYKDDPGVYLNAYGDELPEEMAKACGFPVDLLAKYKLRKERMAVALETIESELSLDDDDDMHEHVTLIEKEGYKLVSIGLGRHLLKDPDGELLTRKHLTEEEGKVILNAMVAKVQSDRSEKFKAKSKEEKEPEVETKAKPEVAKPNPIAKALSKSVKEKK